MIHIIFGAPGKGKSCKQVHFAKDLYLTRGRELLRSCMARIDAANAEGYDFSYPDRAPIFSDFPMRFKIGYEKYFSPYFINGYYLGLPNDTQEVMYVPPGSVIFLSEAQRYYYSRKSNSFPDWVSRFYEMHRHFGLELYMDVQRSILIDANIRELCEHFVEITGLEHERNFAGLITSSTWTCREWTNWKDVERYLNAGEENYAEVTYTNRGNIFRCYDSFSYFDKFLPESGDIELYDHVPPEICRSITDERLRAFYDLSEPQTYRSKKA